MSRLPEEEHPNKAFGWATRDTSAERKMWLSRCFIVGYVIPIFIMPRMNGVRPYTVDVWLLCNTCNIKLQNKLPELCM
ncbi:hypothetical protein Gotur_011502 [Gossypium turneri]